MHLMAVITHNLLTHVKALALYRLVVSGRLEYSLVCKAILDNPST